MGEYSLYLLCMLNRMCHQSTDTSGTVVYIQSAPHTDTQTELKEINGYKTGLGSRLVA